MDEKLNKIVTAIEQSKTTDGVILLFTPRDII